LRSSRAFLGEISFPGADVRHQIRTKSSKHRRRAFVTRNVTVNDSA
jgi:hypothetical protein